ncbi:MAG: alkaline phosphatase family protein [Melioribacteraceae bacterium]|nr:alkaline phosphatase family protein [Melioribacteraceae bacterium]
MKHFLFISLFLITSSSLFPEDRPYVILVSFDGFRWDYLNRDITPNLNSFAQNGIRALSFRPSFPSKTFPNHYSIVTGMYPENHGIISNSFYDPGNSVWYRMNDTVQTRDSKWYSGEPFWTTARKNGIITASFFWPGSEQQDSLRHPDYYKHYDHYKPYRDRVDTVISWLQLPVNKRPQFISVYFHDTDSYGHEYGPNSPEINESISRLDSIAGYLLDSINDMGFKDSVNVIFLSDHGMTETSPDKTINILDIIENDKCKIYDSGPVMRISPPEASLNEVYNTLKKSENHFTVYRKEELPSYYHYSAHELISQLIVVADIGWSLVKSSKRKGYEHRISKGNHGYEKDHTDMHGIFLAGGPAFKTNYQTGTLWNIDVYPLLSKIFSIEQSDSIDGKLERIEFILKERNN